MIRQYLAHCKQCGSNSLPGTEKDRDAWIVEHTRKTGHQIVLSGEADAGDIPETCCGMDMDHEDHWGVRRYTCPYRSHHPVIWVNLNTGERIKEEDPC